MQQHLPKPPTSAVVLLYEGTTTESFGGQAQVTARPVEETGVAVGDGTVAGRSAVNVSLTPDSSLPGFTTGFESGWTTLAAVVSAVVLGVAFMLPLIPLLALAWFGLGMVRRSLAARPSRPAAYAPPPPRPSRETASTDA
jgi:hypothetical protein